MNGPWYTLEEVREKLSLSVSELRHLITTQQLRPVCYTKKREFLLFSRQNDGSWTGHATCTYRGHVQLHEDYIATLLDNEPLNMHSGSCMLLEPEGVQNWRTAYPFKKPLPHEPLSAWEPKGRSKLALFETAAVPFPTEGVSYEKMLEFATRFSEQNKQTTATGMPLPLVDLNNIADLKLNFSQPKVFKPDSLRIACSELLRYQNAQTPTSQLTPPPLLVGTSGDVERENQLHTLILRILEENPKITAKAAQRLIEEDYEADQPTYDTNNILWDIKPEGVYWRSRSKTEQYLAWASLGSLLSKVRKKRAEAKLL